MRASIRSIWNVRAVSTVMLIVFIQTWRGQDALNSRIPAALHRKLSNDEHILKNIQGLPNRKVRHERFEGTIRSHLSNHSESIYRDLTELSNFFQSEKVDSSELSTIEDLIPETSNLHTSKGGEREVRVISTNGARTGRISPVNNRGKRQFEKYTQNVDEAIFQTYEDCISKRSGSYARKQRNLKPEPVLFQEGQSVTLKCILW